MSLSRVVLAPLERKELERRARSRALAVELVKRAKVILMLAAGRPYSEISERLACTDRYISLWKERFKQERLVGLDSRYRGAEHRRRTPQTEARILELTRRGPTNGSTHWSSYRLAKELGISQSTVSRVWRQFGLQPHRSRSYLASDDPEFEEKAADIIGLYLKPPVHAAVFCVDEKSAIQALDRLDPVLPLSPGRAERHGFEYYRHGTLSLYSALNTQTGEVLAKTSARHTSAQFVDFLAQPTLVSKNHVYVGSRSRRRRPKSSSARGIRKNVSPQDLYGIEPAQSKIPEGASMTVSMYLHSVSN
jgi:transposase